MSRYTAPAKTRKLTPIAVATAAVAALAVGSPAVAEKPLGLTASYELSYLGAVVGKARLALESDGTGPRRFALRVRPQQVGGVVNALSGGALRGDFVAELAGDGAGKVLPRRFEAASGDRRKIYRYTGDGLLAGLEVEPAADRKRYRVPDAAELADGPVLHNEASSLAALMTQVGRTRACAARLPFFNGRRRGDMVSRPAPGEAAAGDALAGVRDGALIPCRVNRTAPAEPAGFKDKELVTEDDDALALDFAVVRGYGVPVRAAIEVGAGTARAELTRFELTVAGELVAEVP